MADSPRLLDQVRASISSRHDSLRTERSYIGWIDRYIRFPGTRHPRELGKQHVESFLSHLAVNRNVVASANTPIMGVW